MPMILSLLQDNTVVKLGMQSASRQYAVQDSERTNVLDFQQEFKYAWIDSENADEKKYKKVHPFDIGYQVSYNQL